MHARSLTIAGLAAAGVLCASSPRAEHARTAPPPANSDGGPQTPAQGSRTANDAVQGEPIAPIDAASGRAHAALLRGLAWLAAQQEAQRDGSFPRSGGDKHVPVALAALGALAFMSDGSQPERGPYGEHVAQAIDYLVAHADMNVASETRGYISSEGDALSRMHGHGYATIALAQAFTLSPKSARGQRIREVLAAATKLIETSQGLEGGWYYSPSSTVEHENSVTVVLLQALRAARNVGIDVDSARIAHAVEYIGRCQAENGSFQYTLHTDETTLALTAAGITTLNAAGRYSGPEVERAMTSLWQQIGLREQALERRSRFAIDNRPPFPDYERLYVALALWTQPDKRMFERWYGPAVEALIADQRSDGSWFDQQFGACYATAMGCIFLALPQELLPLFER